MTDDAGRHASEQTAHSALQDSESTAFHIWLLITVSAGIIMAQDTWLSLKQPRLGTMDATASFTKVLVIHALWFLISLAFFVFTWKIRPTSAWRVHIVAAILGCVWTIGVLVSAFTAVETLRVSTWTCTSVPSGTTVTREFLDSCSRTEAGDTIRMGGNIFLWSFDDKHYWRWIVPAENMVTLQTRWPSNVSAIYLATNAADADLSAGSSESVPGGTWSAGFDPLEERTLRIFYVVPPATDPTDIGTPAPHENKAPATTRQMINETSATTP